MSSKLKEMRKKKRAKREQTSTKKSHTNSRCRGEGDATHATTRGSASKAALPASERQWRKSSAWICAR
jgi:hypothetical protein